MKFENIFFMVFMCMFSQLQSYNGACKDGSVCLGIVAFSVGTYGVAGGIGAALGSTVLKSETLGTFMSGFIGYWSAVGISISIACIVSAAKAWHDEVCCND